MSYSYYAFHKPFGYLSQFTDEGKYLGLKHLLEVPADVYAVGRLDADSEGLLLLTNDSSVNQKLLHPKNEHKRVYYIQVEGDLNEADIENIKAPLDLKIKKRIHRTKRCNASLITEPQWLEEREPPIRERKSIPTSWMSLELKEGKNRQVRRMTAAIGFPTLRLLRFSIEGITIEDLPQGELKEMDEKEFKSALKI